MTNQQWSNIEEIKVPNDLSISDQTHLEYYNIQTSPIRYLYIKIEILNEEDKTIAEVSGTATDGSYNISANSIIRRTCDLTFKLDEGYLPEDNDSIFWINKKFHLYVGLGNIQQDKIYWFDKGIYIIKDPNINVTVNNNTIKISGLDKMALYSGDIDGKLSYATKVTVDSNSTRREVVKAIMKDAGELESNINIENPINYQYMDEVIPYDIETSIGDCTTDSLDKVIETLANYQYYYDLNGIFNFKPKPVNSNFKNYNIEWDFEQNNNVVISVDRNIDYSNVKNRVTVVGGVCDDGYQPIYTLELSNDNEDFGNSPFTYDKLNEKHPNGTVMYRDYVEQCDTFTDVIFDFEVFDSTVNNNVNYYKNYCVKYNNKTNENDEDNYTYYLCINNTNNSKGTPNSNSNDWQEICTVNYLESVTNDVNNGVDGKETEFNNLMEQIHAYSIQQCKDKANELMFSCYLANDTITITCVPIYSLDVNNIIIVNDEESGAKGFYVVKEISCQLNASGTMTITAHKLWD